MSASSRDRVARVQSEGLFAWPTSWLTLPNHNTYRDYMTETVALNEAKTQLSALLRRVEAGEEIIIRRGAIPVARLIPERPAKIKPPGSMRGRIWMAEDFDDPLAMFDAYRGDPV